MARNLLMVCLVFLSLTARVQAQQGGAQNPPAPQPAPAPSNPQPQPTPVPQPAQRQDDVTISGRIVLDASGSPDRTIEVRFETDGGQRIGYAYTGLSGEFTYRGVGASQDLYVVVEIEGFKPYRERMAYASLGGHINIFLERERFKAVEKGGSAVIDLKQLRTRIPGKAVDEYEKALKESPKGDAAKVIERLERALKLAPDFYEARNTLGVQYLRLQKYREAEAAFERARDLNPNAADPLINLGTIYYQEGEMQSDAGRAEEAAGRFQKAVAVLEESIHRNPLSAPAHNYLGAALYKIASYERAESMLNRALQLDERLQQANLTLINVYTRQSRFDEALDKINTYLKKNPDSPQRATLQGIKEKIEKALNR